jgi:hypothetical protein
MHVAFLQAIPLYVSELAFNANHKSRVPSGSWQKGKCCSGIQRGLRNREHVTAPGIVLSLQSLDELGTSFLLA